MHLLQSVQNYLKAFRKNRNIGKLQTKIKKAPSEEEIRSFLEKIWSDSKTHNSQTPRIEKLSKEYEALGKQEWSGITLEDSKHVLKKI